MKKIISIIVAVSSLLSLSACSDMTTGFEETCIETVLYTISSDEAKAIALRHSNTTSDEVSFEEEETEANEDCLYYHIKFNVGDIEYEYEVNASSGKIVDFYRRESETNQN